MKKKNTFRKWMALFLSISMVAASGITSNVHLRAAEDTPVQETATENTDASASDQNTDTVTDVNQNDTTRTEEIGLDGTEQSTDNTDNASEQTVAEPDQQEEASVDASAQTTADSASASGSSSSSQTDQEKAEAAYTYNDSTYTYDDSNVTVTATLEKPDAVPDQAEFKVTQITEGQAYDAYLAALNDNAGEKDAYTSDNTLLYDVAFLVQKYDENGNAVEGQKVEYEPEVGSVTVKFNFKKSQLTKDITAEKADDIEVNHLPLTDEAKQDDQTTVETTNITSDDVKVEGVSADVNVQGSESAEFKTDSLSVYAFTDKQNDNDFSKVDWNRDFAKLKSKVKVNGEESNLYYFDDQLTEDDLNKIGGQSNIELEYHYITDDSETFTGNPSKTGYLNDRALGIAGNFHIVAFGNANLGAHTNGNILTNTLTAGANFGTKNFGIESTYVAGDYKTVSGQSGFDEKDVLAVSNTTELGFTDGGSHFTVNGTKAYPPAVIYRDSETKKFIDLNEVKSEISSISNSLAANTDGGYTKNGSTYTIDNPDGVAYINLTADQVAKMGTDVWFDGFKNGHSGSIIINVDMSNAESVTLPDRAKIKIDGQEQGTNEVTTFEAGKIIWNFINASGKVITAQNMSGTIIALGASVELTQNINGTIIAENTHNTAETHRSDFTGITTGDSTTFGVKKNFNGEWPKDSKDTFTFKFEADSKNADAPLPANKTVTLSKDKATGAFGEIDYPYDASKDGKTIDYLYKVSEDASNPVKNVQYDATVYQVKVSVKYETNGTNHSATITSVQMRKSDNDEWTAFDPSKDTFDFTNTYSKCSITLTGTKKLTGRTLKDKEFSFTVKEGDKVVATGTNAAPAEGSKDNIGAINFTPIEYTQDDKLGEHTYTVTEDATTLGGITKDSQSFTVVVNLSKNDDGTLKAEIVSDKSQDIAFTNKYKAETSITLTGTKKLTGRTLKDKEFSFTVKEGDKVVATGSNAAPAEGSKDNTGVINFTEIKYNQDDVGYHTYKVTEDDTTSLGGIDPNTQSFTVVVNVTDNGDGTLKAEVVSDSSQSIAFTNTYTANGEAVLTASKSLVGKTLEAGAYSFELKDSDGKVLQTKKNDADGKVAFDPITYTLEDLKDADKNGEKTYTYSISEKLPENVSAENPTKDGIAYDTHVETVAVHVKDNGNGTLSVTYGNNRDAQFAGANFTNTYATTGQAQFYATKTLSGRTLKEGEFSFALKDGEGKVLQTKSNDANGNVAFDAITYSLADAGKTYTYTISEVLPKGVSADNPTKDGITYDTSEQTVKVKVTDNGDGTLKVTYDGKDTFTGKTFANSYAAEGQAQLSAKKSLSGRKLTAGAYQFVLKEGNTEIQTVSNDKDGNVTFSPIQYTAAGDHTYTISEVLPEGVSAGNPTKDGITYDTHVETVTVHVTDDGKGKLNVTYGNDDSKTFAGANFTNSYAASGEAVLTASKSLVGKTLEAGAYSFELKDADGKVLQTKKNDADGKVAFDPITYTLEDLKDADKNGEKTYTYSISEKLPENVSAENPTKDGIAYDTHVETVAVHVKDNGNGTLSVTYGNNRDAQFAGVNFTNSYAAAGQAQFYATKTLSGKTLEAGEFSFALKDGEGKVLQTKSNDVNGHVAFDAITYSLDDAGKTYTYTISEVLPKGVSADNPTKDGITYDTSEQTVNVKVIDNGDGTLNVTYDGNATFTGKTFANSYAAEGQAQLSAKKSLSGRKLTAGAYQFVLKEGNTEIQTVSNDKDGNVTFSPIQYTAAGDHTYTISEVLPEGVSAGNPTKDGITYDTHVETVTVHVTDDGKGKLNVTYGNDDSKTFAGANFTNSYAASGEAVLTASKSLVGKTLEAGAYSFELKDSDGKVLQTKKNAADGKVTFDPITYSLDDLKDAGEKGKTYTYTISEVLPEGVSASNPTKDGITYDTSVKTVKVYVADNGNGILNVTYGDNKDTTFAGANFTNTYAADGQAQFYATKTLSGRTLEAGEFSFALKDGDGKVLQTKSNDANGHVSFDAIRYSKEDAGKTYTYKISEVLPEGVTAQNPTKDGFTYDTSEQTVKVKVTDNGDGTLKVTYDGKDTFTGKTFANSYAAEGSAQLSARKSLSGKTLTEGAFSFELKEGNNLIQKAANDKDGNVQFDAIRYTEAGDHTYTISEVLPEGVSAENPTKDGITYDTHVETVTVHVTDTGKGKLDVTYGDNKDAAFAGADFTNTYKAQMASATISGTKLLNGGEAAVKAGRFRFDLYDADGNRVDTAANDENGNYIFGRLHFKKAGNYTYTIKEQNAGQTIGGIKYQDEAKTVTISVTDDGYGKLTADDAVVSAFDNTQYGTIKVQKDWDDNGNESYRPSTVEIELIDADTREVVQTLELSELNNWTASFDGLVAGKAYTVHEVENSEYYQAEDNDKTAVADVNGKGVVELTNKFTHPAVTIYANKVLNGGTLTNGEFTFELYRNSDPDTVYKTATNNVAGEIFFTDVEYDEKGYTVKEVKGDDPSISYDEGAIVYDAEGNLTSSSHTEFTNTQRPFVLRVQKKSKSAPYDPLVGATYGLYEVVSGGNDVLKESQVSNENGFMYFSQIEPSTDSEQHIYYFKEIAAPEGHEVNPYPEEKFQVKYTDEGNLAIYGEDGKEVDSNKIIGNTDASDQQVTYTSEKTTLDDKASLQYEDSNIKAVAQAEDGAFEDGTTMKVTQLTGSDLKNAQNKVEAACGKIDQNVVYYDVQFVNSKGEVVEPKYGSVTVSIQYKDSLKLPEGTDADQLKIVHLKEVGDETEVQSVAGTIAEKSGELLQTTFTSDSFSTFGVLQPSQNSSLSDNDVLTAQGVSDFVSRLNIAKLDTSGKYVKGAELQIIDKATGNVMADWKTTDGPKKFARWFDEAKTKSMNVETYYILHEVSAPDGYQLADDILFKINKYDSSITIYKQDANGNLVADQEAIDKWVSDKTLEMIDVPVEVQVKTIPKQKVIRNEKVIQGKDKVVYVTNVKAVKTGDTSAIAMYLVILAIAGAALVLLFHARRAKKNR